MRVFSRRSVGTVRCRDAGRHACRLAVRPHVDASGPRVAVMLDDAEPVLLTPLQVGKLRAALRAAAFAADAQCQQAEQHLGGAA